MTDEIGNQQTLTPFESRVKQLHEKIANDETFQPRMGNLNDCLNASAPKDVCNQADNAEARPLTAFEERIKRLNTQIAEDEAFQPRMGNINDCLNAKPAPKDVCVQSVKSAQKPGKNENVVLRTSVACLTPAVALGVGIPLLADAPLLITVMTGAMSSIIGLGVAGMILSSKTQEAMMGRFTQLESAPRDPHPVEREPREADVRASGKRLAESGTTRVLIAEHVNRQQHINTGN